MLFATQLKKSAQFSLVALSLAGAAGLALSAGQAQALSLNNLLGQTITAGDKTISDITLTGFTPTAAQTIDFSIASGAWVVSTNFAPDQNLTSNISAILNYKITINDPTKIFSRIQVQGDDTTINGGSTTQTVTSTGVTGLPVSNNGTSVGPQSFSSDVNVINVSSSFSTSGGATFNNISQKFTQKDVPTTSAVPGPLPLVGLGAAFGMSRRLRRRIATNG
jgi:uncharacterized Zn-binding protein involved in type VI secretion